MPDDNNYSFSNDSLALLNRASILLGGLGASMHQTDSGWEVDLLWKDGQEEKPREIHGSSPDLALFCAAETVAGLLRSKAASRTESP